MIPTGRFIKNTSYKAIKTLNKILFKNRYNEITNLIKKSVKYTTYDIIKTIDIFIFNQQYDNIKSVKCLKNVNTNTNANVDIFYCNKCNKYFNNNYKFIDKFNTNKLNIDENKINKESLYYCYNIYESYVCNTYDLFPFEIHDIYIDSMIELLPKLKNYYIVKKIAGGYNIQDKRNKLIIDLDKIESTYFALHIIILGCTVGLCGLFIWYIKYQRNKKNKNIN